MQETGDEEEEIYDKSVIKQTLVVARTNDGGDDDDNDDDVSYTISILFRYCIDTASIQYQNKTAQKITKNNNETKTDIS